MKSFMMRAVFLVASASTLHAQVAPAPPLFTRSDAIWSAVFVAGSIAMSAADVRITRAWTDSNHHSDARNNLARNVSKVQEGTLTVGNLALWGIARLAHAPAMADITFHAAESVVVGSIASQVIRGPLGRARPYDTDYKNQYDFHFFKGFTNFKYRAFPSIHTAASFGVATVYTLETERRAPGATWIVAPVAYALAAGPGIARLYNGQHWASDILSGAFVGVLAGAKVERYNHDINPHNRLNRFFLGPKNVDVAFSPSGFSATYSRRF